MRRLGLALPAALVLLGACATLAGLESPGPSGNATLPADQDGGSFPVNDAGAIVSPVRLPIETRCGQTAETAEISIKNAKDKAEINYKVVSTNPSILTLVDDNGATRNEVSGVVPANGLKRIKTRVTSSNPGATAVDLDVTTDGVTQQIRAELSIKGGRLTITPVLIDFGEVRANQPSAAQMVSITNTGNEPVTIESWTLTDGGADFAMQTGSVLVRPDAPEMRSASFAAGPATAPLTAAFVPKTLETTCTESPTLTLKGQRVSTNVTVTPGSLAFAANCNQTAAGSAVEVRNYSSQTATYTVASSAGGGSRFTFPASGSVPGGSDANPGVASIPLTPLASAVPGTHTEQLIVSITSPEASTKTVDLSYRTNGALLQVSPAALTGYSASGQVQSFRVTNVGNDFVYLNFASSNAAFGFDGTNRAGVWEAPGDFFEPNRADIRIKLNATAQGPHSAIISMTREGSPPIAFPPYPSSGALCNSPTVNVGGTIP